MRYLTAEQLPVSFPANGPKDGVDPDDAQIPNDPDTDLDDEGSDPDNDLNDEVDPDDETAGDEGLDDPPRG